MAYLINLASSEVFPLAEHHTFGRLASSVNTCINRPCISKLHTAIVWDGLAWHIKNLGLNGTWLNERQLQIGDNPELAINDHIRLAEPSDPGYRVIDLTPPRDMLWPLDADQALAEGELQPIYLSRYHLLPDAQNPEVAIFFDEQLQSWQQESITQNDHQPRALVDGDLVQMEAQHWQLVRTDIYGPTEARVGALRRLRDFEFVFRLSIDEETTHLELHNGLQVIDLSIRSHHYLLLQLARHRLSDAETGLEPDAQGWIYSEQLNAELGLETTHMNIQIFRVRKQFSDTLADVLGLQELLERRGGRIRLGCDKFVIYKGDTLIATSAAIHQHLSVNE